jgi:hypothetical protein
MIGKRKEENRREDPRPAKARIAATGRADVARLALPGLRVWVPKRIIPRLGALSVVSVRAKQSQFLDCGLRIQNGMWPATCPVACVGRLYKQTQLPKAGHRGGVGRCGCGEPPSFQYSTIPVFQSSGVGRGAIVRNKPNLAGRPGALEGEMCETKPILPGLGRTKSRMDERCKTNPIWAARLLSGRSIVRNKPNSSCRPAPRRAKGAKRTQFGLLPWGRGGPDAPNEANCCPSDRHTARPSASYEDCACRCHPAPRGTYRATSPRCPALGNKANWRAARYGAGSYFVRTWPPGGRSRMGLPWR